MPHIDPGARGDRAVPRSVGKVNLIDLDIEHIALIHIPNGPIVGNVDIRWRLIGAEDEGGAFSEEPIISTLSGRSHHRADGGISVATERGPQLAGLHD